MMGQPSAVSPDQERVTEVTCPDCEQPVDVSVPRREAEPTVSPYVAAFGDCSIVYCPAGHRFWVYYC